MRVAVIGGGYAGMAAAVTLAAGGATPVVFEAGPVLGGRARRVVSHGRTLDNGLHILLGAYTETLRLMELVHPQPQSALTRLPLDWHIYGGLRIKAPPLPAPLDLGVGLLCARGAPLGERVRAAAFMHRMRRSGFRVDADTSVSDLLRTHKQGAVLSRELWEPLCVAALNTPPERASARTFLNVLRDGLCAGGSASDLMLTRSDLSDLFPDPAASYVQAHGGAVLFGERVGPLERSERHFHVTVRGSVRTFESVICAASPHRTADVLRSLPELEQTTRLIEQLQYQPIYTVYLQLAEPYPLPSPMLGTKGLAQWLFDRDAIAGQPGLIAAVISAEGKHQALTQDELASRVYAELCQAFPSLPALAWHRVIAEKRATFEASVDLQRPSGKTPLPNLQLAGDYVAGDYPATLEGAVRSGIAAAQRVLGQL